MRHQKFMKKTISILSAAVAVAMVSNAWAWTSPFDRKYVGKTLSVCDEGSFYVGGVPKITNFAAGPTPSAPQQLTIGQMYVAFQVPTSRKRWPIIIMHGSGYTGACVESTADGKEGWVAYLVRHGMAVFNVDQPGRARSGFDRSVIHEGESLIDTNPAEAHRFIPSLGGASDGGTWTSWYGHLIPNGSNITNGTLIPHGPVATGDPNVHPESNPPSEAHGDYLPAFPIPPVVPALYSLDPFIAVRTPAVLAPLGTFPYGPYSTIGAIGPAPNAVNIDYLALNAYKWSVPNTEATLPNSKCPACVPTTVQALDTWGPRAMAEMVERLGGAIISGHSQGTSPMLHTARILKEHGTLNMLKGIIIPEGAGLTIGGLAAASLTPTDMANVPFLMIQGDYRPGGTRVPNRAAIALLNTVPRPVGPAGYIDTDDGTYPQLAGTTHMNMLGTTALQFMDAILAWTAVNIPNPPAGSNHICGNSFLPPN